MRVAGLVTLDALDAVDDGLGGNGNGLVDEVDEGGRDGSLGRGLQGWFWGGFEGGLDGGQFLTELFGEY